MTAAVAGVAVEVGAAACACEAFASRRFRSFSWSLAMNAGTGCGWDSGGTRGGSAVPPLLVFKPVPPSPSLSVSLSLLSLLSPLSPLSTSPPSPLSSRSPPSLAVAPAAAPWPSAVTGAATAAASLAAGVSLKGVVGEGERGVGGSGLASGDGDRPAAICCSRAKNAGIARALLLAVVSCGRFRLALWATSAAGLLWPVALLLAAGVLPLLLLDASLEFASARPPREPVLESPPALLGLLGTCCGDASDSSASLVSLAPAPVSVD